MNLRTSDGGPLCQEPPAQPAFASGPVGQPPPQLVGSNPALRTSRVGRPPAPKRRMPARSRAVPYPAPLPVSTQHRPVVNQAPSTPSQRGRSLGHAPTPTTVQSVSPQVAPSPRTHQAPQSASQALLPPFNFVLPVLARPDPDRRALHQAHLRSPKYNKVDKVQGNSEVKYYQYVEDIIHLPEVLSADHDLVRWDVQIPHQYWARKAETLSTTGEFLTKRRNLWNGCVQFRLKCISLDGNDLKTSPKPPGFCGRSTKWPRCLSVSINGDMGVDFRRKAHYGVDLPADVTDLLKEGNNQVMVGISPTPAEMQAVYLMAIEIICVSDYNTILQIPGRILAKEAMSSIVTALKNQESGKDDSDDDVVIAQSALSIDLVDPFTSVIWVTPVRGKDCQHRECFDLKSFLQSRTSRDKKSGVTDPDQWKCPICKRDARPQLLVIDEFLLEVRKTLEQRNQLEEARAILVKEDGSWEVKLDPAVSASRSSAQATAAATPAPAPIPIPDKSRDIKSAEAAVTASAAKPTDPTAIVILDDDDN
ncbi:hypothetical protein A1O3_05817 [Capronia epimyces CBS 606.96]|uniref:SP-RING-type domain-containing protein n=1 Tax=Capronia epimyces CBS 606.96 TaxID=1182542 RepID=W9XX43_9EURO|nr:uncharacterized protein A1O3_05817 [Capronia epimyces CBS 606.96]EXJ85142.1 hypothetical protein A1O3_05817 [Capronia epimyces CBS 606.96]